MLLIDCQSFTTKPAPAAMGMVPGCFIDDFAATDQPDGGIDQGKLEKAAEQAVALGSSLLVDIERYPLDIRFNSHSVVLGNVAALVDAMTQLKQKNPTLKIGFAKPSYYWPNRPSDAPQNLPAMRAANADPALKPLYAVMDEACPMLYLWTYGGVAKDITPLDLLWEWINSAWVEWQAVCPNLAWVPTITPRVCLAPGATATVTQYIPDPNLWQRVLRTFKQFQGGIIQRVRLWDNEAFDRPNVVPLQSTPLFQTTVNFAKNESGGAPPAVSVAGSAGN